MIDRHQLYAGFIDSRGKGLDIMSLIDNLQSEVVRFLVKNLQQAYNPVLLTRCLRIPDVLVYTSLITIFFNCIGRVVLKTLQKSPKLNLAMWS